MQEDREKTVIERRQSDRIQFTYTAEVGAEQRTRSDGEVRVKIGLLEIFVPPNTDIELRYLGDRSNLDCTYTVPRPRNFVEEYYGIFADEGVVAQSSGYRRRPEE